MKSQLSKAILSAVAVCFSFSIAQAVPAIENDLVRFAKSGNSDKVAQVVVLFENERSSSFPERYDSRGVVRFLRWRAERAFDRLEKHLAQVEGGDQVRLDGFRWINNSVAAMVSPAGLKALAKAPNIDRIYLNGRITYMRGQSWGHPSSTYLTNTLSGNDWPYSLRDIGIDKLHAEQPSINGSGVVVGSMDTGVDGNHPGLKGKVLAFYDAGKDKLTDPYDLDTHGTHTCGTMVGGDRANAKFGVAPGAKLVSTAALQNYGAMLKGMEWLLDPDKNPSTADFPRVVSNSWRSDGAPDQELFYRAISAWEAAGITVVFSAGNAGPRDETITHPHEHPYVIAVAATGEDGKVTKFSSRGPAIFQGKKVQKPDVSAPGDKVVSSVPGGKMEAMSGTSMAAPHVTGTVALLLQVNPKLTPADIRKVILTGAQPVDEAGNTIGQHVWSKTYGMGRLNAFEAVKMAAGVAKNFYAATHFVRSAFAFTELSEQMVSANPRMEADDFGKEINLENTKWVQAWDIWSDY